MSTKDQLFYLSSQDGSSVIGDGTSLFDSPRWTLGDGTILSSGNIWSSEGGGDAHPSPSHALGLSADPNLTLDTLAPSSQPDTIDDSIANVTGSGDGDASAPLSDGFGSIPVADHIDDLVIQINDASFMDQLQYQLASLSSDASGGLFSTSGWFGAGAGPATQAPSFQSFDVPADATAPSSEPDIAAATADAKGGGGSHPGGGGGGGGGGGHNGGGGGGLLTTYTSGDPNIADASEFNIHIDFSGSWTTQEQAIVTWAANLWSTIITADVRDDTDLNGNPVDDIVIAMSTGRIDGAGNPITGDILAQTQITAVRDPGSVDQWLPVTASIKLDSTDLKNSIADGWSGTWDAIVLHEMGHALGFAGIIFDNLGLGDGSGNFIGANAVAAYGGPVPLENDGGSGTAGSHWDEATFAPNGVPMSNELMTGWLAMNEQTYLSDTTVGAMADVGYHVQDPSIGSSYLVIDNNLLLV
jgi:Leishmanolysin